MISDQLIGKYIKKVCDNEPSHIVLSESEFLLINK
jgi:hypothetical protein